MVNRARTTHRWLGAEQQAALGIGPGTSVGIEGVEDVLEDLDQALRTCQTA